MTHTMVLAKLFFWSMSSWSVNGLFSIRLERCVIGKWPNKYQSANVSVQTIFILLLAQQPLCKKAAPISSCVSRLIKTACRFTSTERISLLLPASAQPRTKAIKLRKPFYSLPFKYHKMTFRLRNWRLVLLTTFASDVSSAPKYRLANGMALIH